MSASLERLAALLDRPLAIVDVGCRDAQADAWAPFGRHVRLTGFEPDADECARLSAELAGPAQREFVPLALGAATGAATLHLTRFPQSSSLYPPDRRTIAAHPQLDAHEPVGERTVELTTLDAWLAESAGAGPDYLKVDVQGAELDVLRGAERALADVRAVEVEVEFQQLYEGQPLFADVDVWLRERGFALWRLRGLRHLAIAGAAPPPGPTALSALEAERDVSGGRLSWADAAIYVRGGFGRPQSEIWRGALRDACLAAAIGLPELAQLALGSAVGDAPATAQETIEHARGDLIVHARATAETLASDAVVARLTAERDDARREVERLRALAGANGARPALQGASSKLSTARARARHWSRPRLGVMRQHPPAPLRVPRRQLRLRPPADPPTIAIVTPSYNQGEFVERTIRSVLDQDYPRLSYAVQDGDSDDGTRAVLDAYRPRLAACVAEPDDGQADAVNRGFARVDGEIMGWINSDDVLLPGALAAVARHFASHPETDVVYGHRAVIDADDRQVGCWILPRHEDWTLRLADVVPQETMFWRRSAWEAAGGRLDPEYRYALDWDLLLRFLDSGARFERLPWMIGAFRVHGEQKSATQVDVGALEMERLLAERGAAADMTQAWARMRPYLRRHVARHTVHRLAMRTPVLSVEIRP